MKTFKAIFFDRDNTITYFNPEKKKFLSEFVLNRTGAEYKLSNEDMMALFDVAGYPKEGLKSLDDEVAFWKRYYYELLVHHGAKVNVKEDSETLFNMEDYL